MSVLEELWNGEIFPSEQAIQKGSEYFRALNQLSEKHEKLLAVLSPEEGQWLDELLVDYQEAGAVAEKEAFVYGFRLAVQMMMDCVHL